MSKDCSKSRPKTTVAFCHLPFPATIKKGEKVILRNIKKTSA